MLMLSIKFYVATEYGQIVEAMFPHQLLCLRDAFLTIMLFVIAMTTV